MAVWVAFLHIEMAWAQRTKDVMTGGDGVHKDFICMESVVSCGMHAWFSVRCVGLSPSVGVLCLF